MVRGESKLQPQEEKNQIIRVKGNLDKRTIIRMGISMWSSGYSAVVQSRSWNQVGNPNLIKYRSEEKRCFLINIEPLPQQDTTTLSTGISEEVGSFREMQLWCK